MTTNIAIDILKWIKTDFWKEGSIIMLKNFKITKTRIFNFLLLAILIASIIYIFFTYKTINLVYKYSDDAKVKSVLVSNNAIIQSENYTTELKEVPKEISKNFVKPNSVVYYQKTKSIFALK